MGVLIDGRWDPEPGPAPTDAEGRFVRAESQFRSWVTPDGSPGPSGEGGFEAAPGRYHLYVSLACPWSHRTLLVRARKRLEEAISVSVVHWHMGRNGWEFREGPGVVPDPIHGVRHLHELYTRAAPRYSGRVTVPVLWDRERDTIVSNESAEIVRMLNTAFDRWGDPSVDLHPEPLRAEIDAWNARIYETVNNGVYRAGFAASQRAYEEAFDALFETLDALELHLAHSRYLDGDFDTEADWRLFATLVRFDPVYFGHFKCNRNRLIDFPHLWEYTRDLYQQKGVPETVDLHHIQHHYYGSHLALNPTGIVPKGPRIDYAAPHGRARRFG